tara:strand:+ start:2558 stop:3529 length:972 start_codon:yes stop_codon:yes gene_type:complete
LDRRIVYVNDLYIQDGYHKFDRHRTPQAYMDILGYFSSTYETCLTNINEDDIVIFQTPTFDELKKLKILKEVQMNNDTFIQQEACIFDWYEWTAEEQRLYVEILEDCNAFMYHNEHDKKLMSLYTDKFLFFPGCTNKIYDVDRNINDGDYISIPCPVKRYQRGMTSHKLVNDVLGNDEKIISMKYNVPKEAGDRLLSFPDSYQIGNIENASFMDVESWNGFIHGSKFGLDINRDFSCGNVVMEYASLGVPLIGNIELDCQRIIYPNTSFEYTDYDNIKKCVKKLNQDGEFYKEVSLFARNMVEKKYHSSVVTKNFIKNMEEYV